MLAVASCCSLVLRVACCCLLLLAVACCCLLLLAVACCCFVFRKRASRSKLNRLVWHLFGHLWHPKSNTETCLENNLKMTPKWSPKCSLFELKSSPKVSQKRFQNTLASCIALGLDFVMFWSSLNLKNLCFT